MKGKEAWAVRTCKLTRKLLVSAGKGGTTLPGRIALYLDPEVLGRVSRDMRIILVTGTNGKTTTCRMLEKALVLAGKKCLLNRSGANLLSGITAEFVCGTDKNGRPSADFAVVECDEGALKQVTGRLHPEVIVVTNLFRDQLDRYGEVMNTRKEILAGIAKAPESVVVLNADCPLTASMAERIPNPVVFYGIDCPWGGQDSRTVSDAKYCVRCGAELQYTYYTYAHLGGYACPGCGFHRVLPETAVTQIGRMDSEGTGVCLRIKDHSRSVKIGLPAIYNVYNALAAICAGHVLGVEEEKLSEAAETVAPPFGRMESVPLDGCSLQMILVKNPAGCSQAMEYITGTGEDYGIAFCLNDKTADGHDISWIWDADFERIIEDPHQKSIWVSGIRAEDMQLRLKYAGAGEEDVVLEKDYAVLLEKLRQQKGKVFVLPNYTAMLEFRQKLEGSALGQP